jgi:hypothetical protein
MYPNDRKQHSIHVTIPPVADETDRVAVGHLEHFTPEPHPVLHTLIDYPLWWINWLRGKQN